MDERPEDIRTNRGEIEQRRTPGFSVRDQRGKYAMDKEKRRIWFRASTSGEKSDGVDILPAAWKKDIRAYMRDNPVMADRHNYEGDSVGQAVDYEIDDLGLMLQMQFSTATARAEELWGLYSAGDQRAVSVGWDTIEYKMEQRGGDDDTRQHEVFVVTRARLLELSTCLVGLDPAAVAIYRDMPCTDCRLELAYRSAFKQAEDTVGGKREIVEKPDRIGEILAELHDQGNLLSDIWERINLVELAMGRAPGEQFLTDEEASILRKALRRDPGSTEPRSVLPPELRKLAEVNSDLTGEALRDRLKEIQRNATE